MADTQSLIEAIIQSQKDFVGEQEAISAARKAPIDIGPDGEVMGYYGKDEVVVQLLMKNYYNLTGQVGLNYIHSYLERQDMEIPEGVEEPASGDGLIKALKEKVEGLLG